MEGRIQRDHLRRKMFQTDGTQNAKTLSNNRAPEVGHGRKRENSPERQLKAR